MKKLKGFTLIELMVVIAIIIILAAIAIPSYITMTKRAQQSKATSDAAVISTALEIYNTDKYGTYPATGWAAMKTALTTNDDYVSAASMAQIEASETKTTYTTPDGKTWILTITTPDGQTGTRTSEDSIMRWEETPTPPPPAVEPVPDAFVIIISGNFSGGDDTLDPVVPATAFFIALGTPSAGAIATVTWQDTGAVEHTVSYTARAGEDKTTVVAALCGLINTNGGISATAGGDMATLTQIGAGGNDKLLTASIS